MKKVTKAQRASTEKHRQTLAQTRWVMTKVIVHQRGTPEGNAQREDFYDRWGLYPQDV